MGLVAVNLPARNEGEHYCLGELVRLEAIRMRECTTYLHGDSHVSAEAHLAELEARIWQWLSMGWTRLRDDGVLVHWRPDVEDWVPFTRALHDVYTGLWNDARAFMGQRLEQARAQLVHERMLAAMDEETMH